ncbi:MAG: ACR3 family arsenite efflux transporter [Pseudomonadota bacterium]
MSIFERYLTIWVAICMIAGMLLGNYSPDTFQTIASVEIAKVNIPVAIFVWMMIIPMLMKIDFKSLHQVKQHWKGIGVTLFVNWGVKPFSMALLGWIFIAILFRPYLPEDQIMSYMAGLIILAAAPCTAMVFVWSHLSNGDPHFTLSQVALNDTIMIFAFAPLVGLLLGISAITIPWDTLILSVVLYILIPICIAQWLRHYLINNKGDEGFRHVLNIMSPIAITALLAIIILLFGFQGKQIMDQPLVIALLAVPIIIQVYLTAGIGYGLSRYLKVDHCVAAPATLIGASNFFELAVATAISLFGIHSGAALATVVGVLIEVPVMLTLVAIVNRSKPWYEKNLKGVA